MGCGGSKASVPKVDGGWEAEFVDSQDSVPEVTGHRSQDNASPHQKLTADADGPTYGEERGGVKSEEGDEGGGEEMLKFSGKPDMTVPSHLMFSGREEECTEEVGVSNREAVPVFFKVKTTHPRLFIVKPNRGKIPPLSRTLVKVTYRPPDDLLSLDKQLEKVKLMVQGLKVKFPDDILPQSVWQMAPKASTFIKPIRVLFTEPESETVDLSKFMSVQVSAPEEDLWWK